MTASLLAGVALFGAAGPARAAEATSSVSITDANNDIRDGVTEAIASAPAKYDVTSASASYKDGRITLDMVTGGADDLTGASLAMWTLFTNSTDSNAPDFVVFAGQLPDHSWSVLVNRGDDFLGNNLCPSGSTGAYDAAKTSYTVAFDASCIGAPGQFRFQAGRVGLAEGENGVYDSAPDGDTLAGPVARDPLGGPAHGYWMVGSDGKVYAFGDAKKVGEPAGSLASAVVDLEPTPAGDGYWIVDDQGRVYAYNAKTFGNVDLAKLANGEKVTSLSATPKG
ncbi:MAG: hypothetical protein LC792_27710, partial [Actinobacteria bacterium]|nr:hypothetical protein [Actinomycetota bacterium]